MKLVGRIPVEPLDDERLTNVERRIVLGATAQPTRASRRLVGFAAVAAAVCAAAAIGWSLHRGETQLAVPSAPLAVHTDVLGSVVDIGDATIDSRGATAFVVTRPNGGVLVEMARGRVELEVGKRHDRPPLVVRAGETDVIVVGTHFSVDFHDGTGDCDVQVTEGVVRVVRRQLEVRVAKGEEWHARDGAVVASIIGDVPRVDPAIEIDTSKTPDVLHARVAAVPDGKVPAAAERPVAPAHASEKPEHPTRLDAKSDPYRDLKAQIRQQTVVPALDVGLDPAASIAKYQELMNAKRRDEAAHATYSIAAVQHLKLGRDVDALRWLDVYMRRFEGADDYAAALWLRVRITCLQKVDQRCREAAYTYISKVPNGSAAEVATTLTHTE